MMTDHELAMLQAINAARVSRGLHALRHDDPHSPVWSAIAEMRPDVGKLNRLRIPCLE